MMMMSKTRTPMHFIGSADFWCSSALCSCETPSRVCSTTCVDDTDVSGRRAAKNRQREHEFSAILVVSERRARGGACCATELGPRLRGKNAETDLHTTCYNRE